MAFWGIVVKPGKPFTHTHDSSKGRLHISQATLGHDNDLLESKSTVQCNVGLKAPVFLCTLFPRKTESLQLHIEFKEGENVMFSVIGPRSVHLTGYYVGGGVHSNSNDESEPDGEDIADTETERSYNSDSDTYEDSFIDDSDPSVSDDEVVETSNKKAMKGKRRRLRKKYQPSESDGENCFQQGQSEDEDKDKGKGNVVVIAESEDEDDHEDKDFFTFSSSLLKRKTSLKSTNVKANNKADKNANQTVIKSEDAGDVELENEAKRGVDQLDTTSLPVAEVEPRNGAKSKKKGRGSTKNITSKVDVNQSNVVDKDDEQIQKQDNNEKGGYDSSLVEVVSENDPNPKKESKEPSKEKSTHEADKIKAGDDLSLFASELGSENGAKSNKKRKEPSKEQSTSEADKMSCDNEMEQLVAENQPKKKKKKNKNKKRNKVWENIDESTDQKIGNIEIKKESVSLSEAPSDNTEKLFA